MRTLTKTNLPMAGLATYRNQLGLRSQLWRLVWNSVWLLAYRPSPRRLHGWRRLLLRCFGAKVGAGVHPYPSARIWAPWHLEMAEDSCLGDGVDCYNVASIRLGRGAIVSQRAFLCTATHDHNDPAFPLVAKQIVVADRSWVAAEAFVGPGVTVGEGAVVGARAVVTKDVEKWSIVAGNPARVIGVRAMRMS